jgi:hypothetical protein
MMVAFALGMDQIQVQRHGPSSRFGSTEGGLAFLADIEPENDMLVLPTDSTFMDPQTLPSAMRQGEALLRHLVAKILSRRSLLAHAGASNTRYLYTGLADFLVQGRYPPSDYTKPSNCLIDGCDATSWNTRTTLPKNHPGRGGNWKKRFMLNSTLTMQSSTTVETCDCSKNKHFADCENRFFSRSSDGVSLAYFSWWQDDILEGHFSEYDWGKGYPPKLDCSGQCETQSEKRSLLEGFSSVLAHSPIHVYLVMNLGGKHHIYEEEDIPRVREILRMGRPLNATIVWKSTTAPRDGAVEEKINYKELAKQEGIVFFDARASTDRIRAIACERGDCESHFEDHQHYSSWVYLVLNVELLQLLEEVEATNRRAQGSITGNSTGE